MTTPIVKPQLLYYFNKQNNLIETIFDLNLLPEEGWNIFEDKLIKDLKDMKIGRICQSYN